MTRQAQLGVVLLAVIGAVAGCAEQSGRGASPEPASTVVARSADEESWVGPQVDPGLHSSWAGPQISPGLHSSWVGPQVDPGLHSSWAGPQVTVAAQTATTLAAPGSSSPSASPVTAVDVSEVDGFVPASPEVAAAVTAAVGRTEAAYDAAVRDLSNPSLRDALAATTADGSSAEELWLGWYDLVLAEGYTYRAPTDGENATTLMLDSVIVADSAARIAVAQVCSASGDTVIDLGPSGSEVVVNTGWAAYEQAQIYARDPASGEWLLSSVIDLETHPGERTCEETPPSSVPSASSSES